MFITKHKASVVVKNSPADKIKVKAESGVNRPGMTQSHISSGQ